ncbi:dTDP-4-amino-4,6-dideoxygalactose transaminase [Roseivirga thermotolerans]|uniref:dTDP-4-amino-4,6-dideoxygalactose transaminase n=1 Tax=Roseivirga thermotolerans TaxID=1758176 RepID=UPI00273E21DA|nr:dTDP-4-amino-4,6-dideoxygalactose transaminase [Roseivirga thermotolerans]
MNIPFNKPYFSGDEFDLMQQAIKIGKISGNGFFSKKCSEFFKKTSGFHSLLTSSCTDALEMSAILLDIQPGDEVIMPSYTFVSTANAFVLRGANIVFTDSRKDHPGMDEDSIESLITEKTKAIVPVHYAGVACDMDKIMAIAKKHNLGVVEDAAQAIDSFYYGAAGKQPLGGIGDVSAFSFHETKNVTSGEGGMLVVNNQAYKDRAEIIWEKGTNRAQFFRGEVDKYSWVDVGSSFLPSDITAAFLYAQLENLEKIQSKRVAIWNRYNEALKDLASNEGFSLPSIPEFATNNGHMFYLVMPTPQDRAAMISFLKERGVHSVFHYLSLHKSTFHTEYMAKLGRPVQDLPQSDHYSNCLIRLPFFNDLTDSEQQYIIDSIYAFYQR